MATETGEKLSFLLNNERVVAVTDSTDVHYRHCANDLNLKHGLSDRFRKEELCETINNLFRMIGHVERLELNLLDSYWRFSLVKVEVIPQAEEEEIDEHNDFDSPRPSPQLQSPSPQLQRSPHSRSHHNREAAQSSQTQHTRRRTRPPPTAMRFSTRLRRQTTVATNSSSVSSHCNSPVRTTTEASPSPSPQHHSSPVHALRPRRGRPNYVEAGQSSHPQPTRRRSRPPRTTVRSSTRLSRRATVATNSPSVSPHGNSPSVSPRRNSQSVSPHRNSPVRTITEASLETESSNARRTPEDIRSEIAKIEDDLSEMVLKLKDEKKKVFLSTRNWHTMAYVTAAIQIVLSEVPTPANPLCFQQFQSQLDELVGNLWNTEMHREWGDDLFSALQGFFENNSPLPILGDPACFHLEGTGLASFLTSNVEAAARKIVEARSHKARLVNELDEMENRDRN